MNSVAGIFLSRAPAQSAIDRLRALGIDEKRMLLLSPGTQDELVEQTVPVTDTEEAGTGERIGSSVGRGAGIAGGIMFGGAVGSMFVPGVGAVVAAGVLGAALLGTMGATMVLPPAVRSMRRQQPLCARMSYIYTKPRSGKGAAS